MNNTILKAPKDLYFYDTPKGTVEITNVKVTILSTESSKIFWCILEFLETRNFYIKVNKSKWYHYLSPFKPKELQVQLEYKTCYVPCGTGLNFLNFYIDEFGNEVSCTHYPWHPEIYYARSREFVGMGSIEGTLISECTRQYYKNKRSTEYQIEIEKISGQE